MSKQPGPQLRNSVVLWLDVQGGQRLMISCYVAGQLQPELLSPDDRHKTVYMVYPGVI